MKHVIKIATCCLKYCDEQGLFPAAAVSIFKTSLSTIYHPIAKPALRSFALVPIPALLFARPTVGLTDVLSLPKKFGVLS